MMELHQLMEMGEVVTSTRPIVAPQQPCATHHGAHHVDAFRNTFAILHNLGWQELVEAGVINEANPMRLWDGFNNDLTTFVLKLDDAHLDALYALVQSRQPPRYRDSSATQVAEAANQNVPGARMGEAGETISVKVS